MSPRIGGTARLLLYVFFLTAPLQVLSVVPFVFVPVFAAALAVLAVLCIADLAHAGKLHIPFELFWPILLLLALGGWAWLHGRSGLALCAAFPLVYWPTYHFARARATLLNCLWLAAVGGGAAGAFSLAAQAGWLFPTVFSPATGARWGFAWDLVQGAQVLAACGLAGVVTVLGGTGRWARGGAAAAAALCFGALVSAGAEALPQANQWTGPPLPADWMVWGAVLLGLWLTARTLAKLALSRMEDSTGLQMPLFALVAASALVWLALPGMPPLVLVGLVALAGSYAQPSDVAFATSPPPRFLLPMAALLAAANLLVVFPGNPFDTRNYARAARGAIHAGQPEAAEARLLFVTALAPEERRAFLWLARARLAGGDPEGAATAFARTLGSEGAALLPPPTEEEADAFLSELRDYCAMLPEGRRGLAYERALLARGETANALTVLRSRARAARKSAPDMSPWPLARGLAALLNTPELAPAFAEWPAGELLGLYASFGAVISEAPPAYPLRRDLPLVLSARTRADTLLIVGHSLRHAFGGELMRGGALPRAERSGRWAELFMTGWSDLLPKRGCWSSSFLDLARVRIAQTPEVRFDEQQDIMPPPGWRAVRVYVP